MRTFNSEAHMRAYITVDDFLNTPNVVDLMVGYLSFDQSDSLYESRHKDGTPIKCQDLSMKCEYCSIINESVVYHHFYGRRYKSLIHDIDNRIPLCGKHHNISSEFSAHLTPADFVDWIEQKRGEGWINRLRDKRNK